MSSSSFTIIRLMFCFAIFTITPFFDKGVTANSLDTQEKPPEWMIFSIYYDVEDRAFERASDTMKRWYESWYSTRDAADRLHWISVKVKTKEDFKRGWQLIKEESEKRNVPVMYGFLYVHASKQTDGHDGLEFASGPGSSTLTADEIRNLPRLPWVGIGRVEDKTTGSVKSGKSELHIFGCNTGLLGERGWCPAQVFAETQKVPTLGLLGIAYFSNNPSVYQEVGPGDLTVYLRAYKRRRNGITGDGSVMKSKWFYP